VQVYLGHDNESAEIRARLVQWTAFMTPWLMTANVVSAVLLAGTLAVEVPSWLRHRRQVPTRVSPAAVHRSALQAGLLASLWAALPWALFPGGSPPTQLLIVSVMLGMVAGGGFVLTPLVPAAIVFTVIIGASTSAAIAQYHDEMATLLSAMIGTYTLITLTAIILGGRRSAGAIRAEREAERQGQLVALLLKDFESQSSDVLWETDAAGRLVRMTPRLMALMRLDDGEAGSTRRRTTANPGRPWRSCARPSAAARPSASAACR
jgi:hypothetical protein